MKLKFELKQPGSRGHSFDDYVVLQYLKNSEQMDTECRNSKLDEGGNDNKKLKNEHNSRPSSLSHAKKKKNTKKKYRKRESDRK